jgi:hypothetical protein
MTELVTSGSVGGIASNGCLYPETVLRRCEDTSGIEFRGQY